MLSTPFTCIFGAAPRVVSPLILVKPMTSKSTPYNRLPICTQSLLLLLHPTDLEFKINLPQRYKTSPETLNTFSILNQHTHHRHHVWHWSQTLDWSYVSFISSLNRSNPSTELKQDLTPDSQKSTLDKASDSVTGTADKLAGTVQPGTSVLSLPSSETYNFYLDTFSLTLL